MTVGVKITTQFKLHVQSICTCCYVTMQCPLAHLIASEINVPELSATVDIPYGINVVVAKY